MVKRATGKATMRAYLRCRAYGHNWDDRGWIAMIRKSIRGWDQEFTCGRCTGTRNDFRARSTLKLLHRSYTLPNGYPGDIKPMEALKSLIELDAVA